jgi:coenzyme F420 hydrogenase subunit beta
MNDVLMTSDGAARVHSIEAIVSQGLCMGCGLCRSIAGPGEISIEMNGEGGERPVVHHALAPETVQRINDVCPGLRVQGHVPDPADPVDIHPIWGPTRLMAIGHAGDEAVRFHASSGGALSALGLHMLARGEVDFILHVAGSRSAPLRSAQHLSFDAAQVMEGSGSRYGPAAPLTDFRAVLDRGRPFAFIGKACDITAIRNYAKFDPRVDELLRYTLNFYCGGVSEFGKTMDYVRGIGRTEQDITGLRYRGDGCPGEMDHTRRHPPWLQL